MGEQDVDRIIEAWRAEARTTGESAAGESPQLRVPARGRASRIVQRAGRLRVLAAAAAVAVFAVAALAVFTTTAPAPSAEPAVATPSPAAEEPLPGAPLVDGWFSVVQQIDAVRAAAYSGADPKRLDEVFAEGGPALAREQAAVQSLVDAGLRVEGWEARLLAVSQTQRLGEQVELRVTDERSSYDLVGADGSRTTVPAAPRTDWRVTLVARDGTWVVQQAEVLGTEAVTSQPGPPESHP